MIAATPSAVLWTLTRWALAGVFIYAGVAKVMEAQSLAASIARFQMVPEALIHPMALGLPVFEILCGIALVAGPWKRQAAFSIAALCVLFLGALVSANLRGIVVECTCFGASAPEPIWRSIVRDLTLLVAALAIYARTLRRPRPSFVRYATSITALNGTY